MTYYKKANMLPWTEAKAFCEGLSGSTGLSSLPHWPYANIKALWTSSTRGQHWNYPQSKVYHEVLINRAGYTV